MRIDLGAKGENVRVSHPTHQNRISCYRHDFLLNFIFYYSSSSATLPMMNAIAGRENHKLELSKSTLAAVDCA